eukprot:sb/3479277/
MSLNRGPTVYRYDYPSQEMFPTKRTPSPKRGRDIKRRIEMPPSRGPDVGRREAVREVSARTLKCCMTCAARFAVAPRPPYQPTVTEALLHHSLF